MLKFKRQEQAKQNRELSSESKMKLSVLKLHKWDLVREHRQAKYEGAFKVRNFSQKMQYMVKLIKTR